MLYTECKLVLFYCNCCSFASVDLWGLKERSAFNWNIPSNPLENCNICHLVSLADRVPLVSSQRTALCLLLLWWSKPVGPGGSEAIQGHARIRPSTPTILRRGGPRPWRQEWGCQPIREAQGPREVSWLAEVSGAVVWYQLWCSVMFKWAQLKGASLTTDFFLLGWLLWNRLDGIGHC